jgi:hypothetical protein
LVERTAKGAAKFKMEAVRLIKKRGVSGGAWDLELHENALRMGERVCHRCGQAFPGHVQMTRSSLRSSVCA